MPIITIAFVGQVLVVVIVILKKSGCKCLLLTRTRETTYYNEPMKKLVHQNVTSCTQDDSLDPIKHDVDAYEEVLEEGAKSDYVPLGDATRDNDYLPVYSPLVDNINQPANHGDTKSQYAPLSAATTDKDYLHVYSPLMN
jgi:hypothetical protein